MDEDLFLKECKILYNLKYECPHLEKPCDCHFKYIREKVDRLFNSLLKEHPCDIGSDKWHTLKNWFQIKTGFTWQLDYYKRYVIVVRTNKWLIENAN